MKKRPVSLLERAGYKTVGEAIDQEGWGLIPRVPGFGCGYHADLQEWKKAELQKLGALWVELPPQPTPT